MLFRSFDGGWTVEMAIPFKSLRYQPGPGQTWGLNMNRIIKRKNERTWLAPMPAAYGTGVFRVSVAATLVGLETPPMPVNLDVKPYVIGGLTTDHLARPAYNNKGTKDKLQRDREKEVPEAEVKIVDEFLNNFIFDTNNKRQKEHQRQNHET